VIGTELFPVVAGRVSLLVVIKFLFTVQLLASTVILLTFVAVIIMSVPTRETTAELPVEHVPSQA
jgi:hypothetical protein